MTIACLKSQKHNQNICAHFKPYFLPQGEWISIFKELRGELGLGFCLAIGPNDLNWHQSALSIMHFCKETRVGAGSASLIFVTRQES